MNLTKIVRVRLKMLGGAESSSNDLLKDVICVSSPCERLSSGNFGEVYKGAYQEEGKDCYKKVGLKVLSNTDENSKNEFVHEKEMALRLKGNPNVVEFYGETEFPGDKNRRCLVFEYCKHGDLKSYLDPDPTNLDFGKKIKILKQICEGMVFIHERKVLHRDLAARNILLDKNFNAKVADFGLAVEVKADDLTYPYKRGTNIPIRYLSPKFFKKEKEKEEEKEKKNSVSKQIYGHLV